MKATLILRLKALIIIRHVSTNNKTETGLLFLESGYISRYKQNRTKIEEESNKNLP